VLGPKAATVAAVLGLLAACATVGSETPTHPPGDVLRVMTWNVETRERSPAEWAPTIADARPDVLGLQEICAGEAVELAELLRRDHGLAYEAVPGPIRPVPGEDGLPLNVALRRPCRDGAVVTYGLAVLSRLPVETSATELFPPDHRDEQRGYQRLTLRGPDSAPLAVYNVHVGLAGVQPEQIRALGAAAAGEAGATVVLGDLNVPAEAGDVPGPLGGFDEVDPDGRLPTSDNRADTPGAPADEKIDYIFHRGLVASSPPTAPWVPSSDHRPLIAALRPVAPTR
jgi:endonuclease/exonuclease/phosphatase family metal-dependent hydrolase